MNKLIREHRRKEKKMNVIINSVHFKADRKLENFIENKVNKLSTFHDGVIGSEVTLKVLNTHNDENKIAEVRLNIKGEDLFASKQNKTFEQAISEATDVLKRQLKKNKEKRVKK